MPFQHRMNHPVNIPRRAHQHNKRQTGSDKVHVKEKPKILEMMILFMMCPLVEEMIFMIIIANNVSLNLEIRRKFNETHVTSFSVQSAIPITIHYPQLTSHVRRAKIQARKKFHQKSKKQNAKRKTEIKILNFGIVRMTGAIIL